MFERISIIYQPIYQFSLKQGLVHMIMMKCTQLMAELFRNDETSNVNCPYHGIAVYSRLRMLNGYPYARNCHGI